MVLAGPEPKSMDGVGVRSREIDAPLDAVVEAAIKRDKAVAVGGLFIVVALSWLYILTGAGMNMMEPAIWNIDYAGLMFIMWWVMMVAMMLPSASPMILLFATMNRRQKETGKFYVPVAVFASAYLATWAAFSVVAVAVQWGLESMSLLSPMMETTSVLLGGILLLVAGLYQLTPLKQACLKNCRSPVQFVLTRWRSGASGAFLMGIEHGAYCVGCCWFLMGLLFFGGVMNLYWIVGLAVLVLLEKTVPAGHRIGHVVGVALMIWGVIVLAEIG